MLNVAPSHVVQGPVADGVACQTHQAASAGSPCVHAATIVNLSMPGEIFQMLPPLPDLASLLPFDINVRHCVACMC